MDNTGFSLPAKGFVRRETSKLNFEIILYVTSFFFKCVGQGSQKKGAPFSILTVYNWFFSFHFAPNFYFWQPFYDLTFPVGDFEKNDYE